ncbi:MAG: DUF4912 domain-containing protein [Chthoniobacterales bacterium]
MDFKLQNLSAEAEPADDVPTRKPNGFTISPEPLISDVVSGGQEGESTTLPRSYGTQSLWLMPRDPQSFFACWDIDWNVVFRDGRPADRKVHLRVFSPSEETMLEVEPMAGTCHVAVARADESYNAEIGYYGAGGAWVPVATSTATASALGTSDEKAAPDFATIPFHLSFQRMIDLFRASKRENESLTAMLAALHERAASGAEAAMLSAPERELARALEEATAGQPPADARDALAHDLWALPSLQRIIGFGGTSPVGPFGSSRTR